MMYPVATGEYGTKPFGSNGVIRVPSMNFIEDSPLKSHALYRVCLPLFQVKACPSPERATLPAFLEHVTVRLCDFAVLTRADFVAPTLSDFVTADSFHL